MTCMMVDVAPGLMFGSVEDAFDFVALQNAGITHILNVASELNFSERVGLHYQKIAIDDDSLSSNMQLILSASIDYIRNAIEQGGKVLVHCLEGKSRSVCVVIAYMMVFGGQSCDFAVEHIKRLQPNIDIFPLYLEQTKIYAKAYNNGVAGGAEHTLVAGCLRAA